MSREVPEWVADNDNQAIPARVKVRFEESYIPEPNSGCWLWLGYAMPNGYGTISINRKNKLAHRVAFQISHGPIASGAEICHRCDNTFCVNPAHLFLGSHADNMADCAMKRRIVTPMFRGESHKRSKLTNADVLAIRADDRPSKHIAADYGVSRVTVWAIKSRKAWGHLA